MATCTQINDNSIKNENSHIVDGDSTARLLLKVCRLWLNVVNLDIYLKDMQVTAQQASINTYYKSLYNSKDGHSNDARCECKLGS